MAWLIYIHMKNAFGRYIGVVYCAFLRLCDTEPLYYLVSANVSNVISCRVKHIGASWELQHASQSFFIDNMPLIIQIIEDNERLIIQRDMNSFGRDSIFKGDRSL